MREICPYPSTTAKRERRYEMKSAEDKARDFVSALPLSVAVVRKEVEALTVRLLKEQDRDTRHACAEAVIQLPECLTANDNAIYDCRGEICDAIPTNAAHDACMNVKAV
jgi:hypothetical protein